MTRLWETLEMCEPCFSREAKDAEERELTQHLSWSEILNPKGSWNGREEEEEEGGEGLKDLGPKNALFQTLVRSEAPGRGSRRR